MNALPNMLLFEDHQVEHFYPLTRLHAFYDLQWGTATILEKAVNFFRTSNVNLHCRPELKQSLREKHPGLLINSLNASLSCFMLNARLILTPTLVETFKKSQANQVWIDDSGEIAAMHLNHAGIAVIQNHLAQGVLEPQTVLSILQPLATIQKLECTLIRNYWEMLLAQTQVLKLDFQNSLDGGNIKSKLHPASELIAAEDIAIGSGCEIGAHTILDASHGPIWIGDNVHLKPFTWIQGPALINSESVLEKASIQNSIIGKSNYVAGNVKDSWTGDAVSIGHLALVQKSFVGSYSTIAEQAVLRYEREDLKPISLPFQKRMLETHQARLGAFMGDYSLISPQSVLPAGTVMGIGSIYKNQEIEGSIPEFSFPHTPRLMKKREWDELEPYLKARHAANQEVLSDISRELLSSILSQ